MDICVSYVHTASHYLSSHVFCHAISLNYHIVIILGCAKDAWDTRFNVPF